MFFWGKRKNYISIYSLALCFCSLGQFFFVPFILQAYLEKRSWQYLKHHIKMVTLKDENVLFLEASGSFSSWGVFIDEYWCFLAYLYELRNLDCLFFSIWTMNELVVLILCQMCLERHVQSLSNTMYSILDVIKTYHIGYVVCVQYIRCYFAPQTFPFIGTPTRSSTTSSLLIPTTTISSLVLHHDLWTEVMMWGVIVKSC